VGIDRYWRRWETPEGPVEEVWRVPFALPALLRVVRGEGGEAPRAFGWFQSDDGAVPPARLVRIAEASAAMHRSWGRELSEGTRVEGPDDITTRFDWARARVLTQADPDAAAAAGWQSLALAALGRFPAAVRAARALPAGALADQVLARLRAWAGTSGALPSEEAPGIPPALRELEGDDDVTSFGALCVGAWAGPPGAAAHPAARFILTHVHEDMGVRVDARFGRLRWGPGKGTAPTPDHPLRLWGLAMGQTTVDLEWAILHSTHATEHVYRIVPGVGAVPVQALFEPQVPGTEVVAVELNGQPVDAERFEAEGGVGLRFQTPLERPLELRVTVAAE